MGKALKANRFALRSIYPYTLGIHTPNPSLRLKDLLGPVTRVKKTPDPFAPKGGISFFFFFVTLEPRVE